MAQLPVFKGGNVLVGLAKGCHSRVVLLKTVPHENDKLKAC